MCYFSHFFVLCFMPFWWLLLVYRHMARNILWMKRFLEYTILLLCIYMRIVIWRSQKHLCTCHCRVYSKASKKDSVTASNLSATSVRKRFFHNESSVPPLQCFIGSIRNEEGIFGPFDLWVQNSQSSSPCEECRKVNSIPSSGFPPPNRISMCKQAPK